MGKEITTLVILHYIVPNLLSYTTRFIITPAKKLRLYTPLFLFLYSRSILTQQGFFPSSQIYWLMFTVGGPLRSKTPSMHHSRFNSLMTELCFKSIYILLHKDPPAPDQYLSVVCVWSVVFASRTNVQAPNVWSAQ